MTRSEFIKLSGLLGIGLPFHSTLSSCTTQQSDTNFSGRVLIIGAGVAGLSAGYLLQQQNIEYQILEAQSTFGGRIKRTTDFADFPIPLGAEWLHTDPSIFDKIINDDTVNVEIETAKYDRKDQIGSWEDGKLYMGNMQRESDLKFVNSTWFDFYNEYIYPFVAQQLKFNTAVKSINYSNDSIKVEDTNGNIFEADKIIFTAPLKMLQLGKIEFNPSLPESKLDAINEAKVWGGLKVFMEFGEKFYPTYVEFPELTNKAGQYLYYDASFAQNSTQNILGLFSVGAPAEALTVLGNDEIKNKVIAELDKIFDGKASKFLVKYLVQNWTTEPFFQGAYISDFSKSRLLETLGESVSEKIYFAGEAYTDGSDWGSAHAAAAAAKTAVEAILDVRI